MQGNLPFVVGRSAAEQLTILPNGLEGRRFPEVQRIDRLDIVVTVKQDRRLARGLQPVGIDDRMSGGVDDLRVLQPDSLVLLGEVARGAADVVGVFGLARYARDAEKVLELAEPLLTRLVEEFPGGRHRTQS